MLLCKILISLMNPLFFFEGNCRSASKWHQFICSTNEKFPYDADISKNDIEWLQSKIDFLESLIQNAQLVCLIDNEILYCISLHSNNNLQQSLHCLQIDRDQLSPQQNMVEYSGKPGRPRCQIYSDQLSFLQSLNCSVTDIAKFLGVSVRTVHRRMSGFSLSVSNLYSTVTDHELDAVLRDQFFQDWIQKDAWSFECAWNASSGKTSEEKFSQGRFRRCH